jgi:hypothetical protein
MLLRKLHVEKTTKVTGEGATPNWGMYTRDHIIFWTCEPPHTRNHLASRAACYRFAMKTMALSPRVRKGPRDIPALSGGAKVAFSAGCARQASLVECTLPSISVSEEARAHGQGQ